MTAANGTDACAALTKTEFDVVITDLRMPGAVSGRDLLAWIEREQPTLSDRVIVVTGDTMGEQATGPMMPPAERVLTKPFDAADYRDRVQRALAAAPARMMV